MGASISDKEISIQYMGHNGEVVYATFRVSETGALTYTNDSISNAENSIVTGTPVLDLLAQTTGVVFWSENNVAYVINPNLSNSYNLSELMVALINVINNTRGWFAAVSARPQYAFNN